MYRMYRKQEGDRTVVVSGYLPSVTSILELDRISLCVFTERVLKPHLDDKVLFIDMYNL